MRELQTARDRILDLERQLEHASKQALKHSAEVARLESALQDAAAKVGEGCRGELEMGYGEISREEERWGVRDPLASS